MLVNACKWCWWQSTKVRSNFASSYICTCIYLHCVHCACACSWMLVSKVEFRNQCGLRKTVGQHCGLKPPLCRITHTRHRLECIISYSILPLLPKRAPIMHYSA